MITRRDHVLARCSFISAITPSRSSGRSKSAGDVRLDKPFDRAAIIARAVEPEAVNRRRSDQRGDGVRQLDLVARAALAFVEVIEHLWRQNVAPDDRRAVDGASSGSGFSTMPLAGVSPSAFSAPSGSRTP